MYVLASTRFCNIYAIYSSKLKRFVAVTLRVAETSDAGSHGHSGALPGVRAGFRVQGLG